METEVPLPEISIDKEKESAEVPLLAMVTSLREEMSKLFPLTPNHCIYRVPKQLYVKNPAAYTPKVVSIGPIHHKREGLEAMEGYKQRYLQLFLARVKISLEDYAEFVMDREGRLRECYADTINLTSNEFLKIMMIDSAFVYEMLVRIRSAGDESCRIFNRPYLIMHVIRDLLLLENQIPLFILEDLFKLDKEAKSAQRPTSSIRTDDLKELDANLLSDWGEDASRGEGQMKSGTSSLKLEDAAKLEEQRKSNISLSLENLDRPPCCANMLRPPSQRFKSSSRLIIEPALSISPPPEAGADSFMDLVCKFVNWRLDIGASCFDFNMVCSSKVVHLLDCLRRCHLSPHQLTDPPPSEAKTKCCVSIPCFPGCPRSRRCLSPPGESDFRAPEPESGNIFCQLPSKVGHLLVSCLWRCHRPCSQSVPPQEAGETFHLVIPIPTITELHQSGVEFTKNSESTNLLEIKFDCQRGILKIPHFFMGDSTETIFRNLLAFEQCHYMGDYRFTDYFILLDDLISDPSDIDLLVQCGVLESKLGDNKQATSLINNIALGLTVYPPSYFDSLRKELCEYYKVPWHQWKATLRHDYFNNPWAGISVIAAVILLVLTVVQTVYTVISK